MYLHRIVSDIDDNLLSTPEVASGGSLLIMVGLPGTGKSSIVEALQPDLPCSVISTDNVRLQMRNQPTYTAAEMMLVYEVCYSIIELRLRRNQRVVFDASNYLAARREHVAKIAKRCRVPVAICYVQASQAIIRQRLFNRVSGNRRESDLSDADWSVYKWMVEAQEPVVGEHLILDTTSTAPQELADKLYQYWLNCEANAASDPDLQSPRWANQLKRTDRLGR
jgi:predicted kinase